MLGRSLHTWIKFLVIGLWFAQISALGHLGIRQDQSALAATGQKDGKQAPAPLSVFTSVAKFSSSTLTLKNEELFGLAQAAYNEMIFFFAGSGQGSGGVPKRQQPSVMSALAIGDTIYFASSIKGEGGYVYNANRPESSEVEKALFECQIGLQLVVDPSKQNVIVDLQHRTKASCGEVMARILYDRDTDPNKPALNGMRIVSYGKQGRAGSATSAIPLAPCGRRHPDDTAEATTWGCQQFMSHQKIATPDPPSPQNLPTAPLTPISFRYPAFCEAS